VRRYRSSVRISARAPSAASPLKIPLPAIPMASNPRVHIARTVILLGAAWVLAGALFKLFAGSPTDLPSSLRGWLDAAGVQRGLFFRLAIAAELVVVVCAVLRPRWGWAPLAALFVVFDIVLTPLVLSGEASCGCFGSAIPIKPQMMMAIDTALLVAILASRPWSAPPSGIGPGWLVALLALGSLPLPFLLIGSQPVSIIQEGGGDDLHPPTMTIEGARFISLEPSKWIGKDIFETDLARYLDWEARNLPIEGLVVFYRWTCDRCALHMEQVVDQDDFSRPILLVRVPERHDNDENGAIQIFPEGSHVTRVSLPRGPVWDLDTPADLLLEGAIVHEARTKLH
jgi:hypothetical protein